MNLKCLLKGHQIAMTEEYWDHWGEISPKTGRARILLNLLRQDMIIKAPERLTKGEFPTYREYCKRCGKDFGRFIDSLGLILEAK